MSAMPKTSIDLDEHEDALVTRAADKQKRSKRSFIAYHAVQAAIEAEGPLPATPDSNPNPEGDDQTE